MSKILLVEDDKSLREIYGVRLAAEGYEIVSVGDGEEALTVAIKERPDLIVSDVMMPKISGFDMLDILRATPETKDLKVIMMTALSSDDQRARGEALGADRYLVKSQVGIEDVVRTVHEVLGDTPGAIAPAGGSAFNAPAPAAPFATPDIAATPSPVEQPVADFNTTVPPVASIGETPIIPDLPEIAPIDTIAISPVVEPVAAEQNFAQPAPEAAVPTAPEPYPRAIDTPAPEPTVISAPEPVVAPQPATLPQPVAPFSSSAPASLGDQITAAAQAASIATGAPAAPAPAPAPVEPSIAPAPVGITADPLAVSPVIPEPQLPPQAPVAPITPEQPAVATPTPQAPLAEATANIADLINQELQSDTTTPQQ